MLTRLGRRLVATPGSRRGAGRIATPWISQRSTSCSRRRGLFGNASTSTSGRTGSHSRVLPPGVQAPDRSRTTQDWRWIVVTDAEKRAALAESTDGRPRIPRACRPRLADRQTKGSTRAPTTSPARSNGAGPRDPVHREPLRPLNRSSRRRRNVDHPGGVEFMLALRSWGLGSVWTTLHLDGAATRSPNCSASQRCHAGRVVPGGVHDRHRFQACRPPAGREHHVVEHVGCSLMHVHREVPGRCAGAQGLASPAPAAAARGHVATHLEYPAGRIEILFGGDEANQGLVRTCIFPVPTFLLSSGKARRGNACRGAAGGAFPLYRDR